MRWLKRLLLVTGLLASTMALLVLMAGLFIFALQSPVEMKSAGDPHRIPEILSVK